MKKRALKSKQLKLSLSSLKNSMSTHLSTRFTQVATSLALLFFGANMVSFAAEEATKEAVTTPETEAQLPASAQRYIDFYTSPQLVFSIDPDSIKIIPGADYEIRYTLKATSKQGATNVSYEGISCNNRLKIIYAIGRTDGTWSRTRSPQWTAIYATGANIQHATLANEYFCAGTTFSGDLSSIKSRIESKRPISN